RRVFDVRQSPKRQRWEIRQRVGRWVDKEWTVRAFPIGVSFSDVSDAPHEDKGVASETPGGRGAYRILEDALAWKRGSCASNERLLTVPAIAPHQVVTNVVRNTIHKACSGVGIPIVVCR
ncbi:MAG: hypothetical protein ACI9KE_001797, partial [Polyangiales bacterium]